jgi:DNA-3-methyladenine glycosylase
MHDMTSRNRIADRPPDARLRIDPDSLGLAPLPRSFFLRDTRRVARDLLSCWIVRRWRGAWYGGRIVETEAYLGRRDRAAHSWGGRRTPRVEPMYAAGGHLYVFLVYGMHHCANVVTRREGVAEAVLLRAAEPPPSAPPRLLSGPGRLCAGLSITTAASGRDLLASGSVAIVRPRRARRPVVGVSARIGVDYAKEAAAWPLRFFDADSPAVSGRAAARVSASRRTRRPPRRAGL